MAFSFVALHVLESPQKRALVREEQAQAELRPVLEELSLAGVGRPCLRVGRKGTVFGPLKFARVESWPSP